MTRASVAAALRMTPIARVVGSAAYAGASCARIITTLLAAFRRPSGRCWPCIGDATAMAF